MKKLLGLSRKEGSGWQRLSEDDMTEAFNADRDRRFGVLTKPHQAYLLCHAPKELDLIQSWHPETGLFDGFIVPKPLGMSKSLLKDLKRRALKAKDEAYAKTEAFQEKCEREGEEWNVPKCPCASPNGRCNSTQLDETFKRMERTETEMIKRVQEGKELIDGLLPDDPAPQ